jgi:hypothetical protein
MMTLGIGLSWKTRLRTRKKTMLGINTMLGTNTMIGKKKFKNIKIKMCIVYLYGICKCN